MDNTYPQSISNVKEDSSMQLTERGKQFVYDLTMEFIRQNNTMRVGNLEEIPDKMEIVAKFSQNLETYIADHRNEFSFL